MGTVIVTTPEHLDSGHPYRTQPLPWPLMPPFLLSWMQALTLDDDYDHETPIPDPIDTHTYNRDALPSLGTEFPTRTQPVPSSHEALLNVAIDEYNYNETGLNREPNRPTTMSKEANLDFMSISPDAEVPCGHAKTYVVDEGSTLISEEFVNYAASTNSRIHPVSTGEHGGNGRIERLVRTTRNALQRSIAPGAHHLWRQEHPRFLANYNATYSSTIQNCPYTLVTGRVYSNRILDAALGYPQPTVFLMSGSNPSRSGRGSSCIQGPSIAEIVF
ncbi:hypothetical protein SARC_01310 [Sphaeroforma arctica JP610]|uniref:Integrase catalytic domain-containing protein n=1 Tax=Sphaeroforma arctica JP610 TaxID=667725 RepID=A0A0L0GBZ8_9EUKA|nr:hypothetical protein SARC_01310 [Sphaeroforma arctica JP610]KNC86537.1 hypothetical protein SARC_01310 [Sphaeroforma arctica JP610]|eukprot:XP_014160439.1 hypothetical protein SARC_01310 [Sphaeroforma arctica JP610]